MSTFKAKHPSQRLDLFLKEAARQSRKQAKKMIDEGRVTVNGRKVIIASWELKKGDTIALHEGQDNTSLKDAAKKYFLKVVFEDDTVLVVEKDSGIASEPTANSLKPSLPEIVYEYLKRAHPHLTHPYVLKLHRLDRDTSGLMVYGKSKAAQKLLNDFKRHMIERRYIALVEGKVKKQQGRIEVALLKNPLAKGKKMTPAKEGEGKPALTEYQLLRSYKDKSLLELQLKTGRTHQVRAHLAWLGHPVVGDKIYGKNPNPTGVLALHASKLGFTHPVTGKKLIFHSKSPKRIRDLVDRLTKDA